MTKESRDFKYILQYYQIPHIENGKANWFFSPKNYMEVILFKTEWFSIQCNNPIKFHYDETHHPTNYILHLVVK